MLWVTSLHFEMYKIVR